MSLPLPLFRSKSRRWSIPISRQWTWSSPSTGLLLALFATGLFVLIGALVRLLSDDIGLAQILFCRQVVFLLLLLPFCKGVEARSLIPSHWPLHLLRIVAALAALSLGYLAVSQLPLADATALGFVYVPFAAIIATGVLKESIPPERWWAIAVGFVGVMLMVQPRFDHPALWPILAGLGAAMATAIAASCVRRLAQSESRLLLLGIQALAVGMLVLVPALLQWQHPTPNQWGLLMAVGALSALATGLGITALKHCPAHRIAQVEYAKMIYALALGYGLFAEVPNALAWSGLLILLASALLPGLTTRARRKRSD